MSGHEVVVACCQLELDVENPAECRSRVCQAIEQAAAHGADIVVLPELAATGYRFKNRAEVEAVAENADGPSLTQWQALAARHDIVVVGGFVEAGENGDYHNSAALVDGSGVRAIYRKAHLWDEESTWFRPGTGLPPVVQTRFGKLGVLVCYDLEFPEWVRLAALNGTEILCAPVNWPLFPRPAGERPSEVIKVQADASVNRMYVAACDRAGPERGIDWLGGSIIVDPDGYPLTELRLGLETTVSARVDPRQAAEKAITANNDVFADRRPALYDGLQES
ncbi:MAG TPA: nitrilase-related carbon-nitrogen hydrolase [Marmoricola sp.]|nr:nitrilase-related carbon-nitrogen hydrolase [Marmoricola sp.]